jgi:hypothetical protein
MALHWAWSWEADDPTVLPASGFILLDTNTASNNYTSTASDLWTYTGSPTRYSWEMSPGDLITLPPEAVPSGVDGAVSFPCKSDGTTPSTNPAPNWQVIRITFNTNDYVRISQVSGSSALRLRVDGFASATELDTSAIDLSTFRYLTLKFDFTTTTYTASLYMDGVLVLGPVNYFHASNPIPSTITKIEMGSIMDTSKGWKIGQVITYDDTSAGSENPRYVTNFDATSDLPANVGTWTPGGSGPPASDNAAVSGPLNTATYTENTTPLSGNKVTLTGGTITSQLGVTPTNVDAVVVHTVSTGEAINARAEVGDGVSTTDGATTLIDAANPTYASVTATTKPSGGAWAGTDSPELNYEIV